MSNDFELNCEVRTDKGKGASRRLRRLNNQIPAILYGGDEDPQSLTINHDEILHATDNEAFFSHIITLNIGKDKQQAVIKALQRHPAKPFIMHADFQRVQANVAITVNVPIHFLNEEKCKGVRLEGGVISRTLNEIEVSCLPGNLPEYIEVDLLELGIGDAIHLSEVTLPEGVTSVALSHGEEQDLTVVTVMAPMAEEPEEDEVEAAAEGEEAADGDDADSDAEEKPEGDGD